MLRQLIIFLITSRIESRENCQKLNIIPCFLKWHMIITQSLFTQKTYASLKHSQTLTGNYTEFVK